MDDVVILTGFMGSGKSATGRLLAAELGWDFLDLDEEVERVTGKSVARIFAEDGEPRFRDLEAEALERALRRTRLVVAAGGGMLLREDNRRRLSDRLVVNLDAPPEECVRRVRGSATERPLLAGPDPEAAARRLWEQRRALHEAVPRRVDTRGKSPRQVAREIAERFLKDRSA
ncbi:MAG: shikimate kinase [Deferrisomatales bacterium]|nr:shikimate kinase [Deferrisomatales bacterium]